MWYFYSLQSYGVFNRLRSWILSMFSWGKKKWKTVVSKRYLTSQAKERSGFYLEELWYCTTTYQFQIPSPLYIGKWTRNILFLVRRSRNRHCDKKTMQFNWNRIISMTNWGKIYKYKWNIYSLVAIDLYSNRIWTKLYNKMKDFMAEYSMIVGVFVILCGCTGLFGKYSQHGLWCLYRRMRERS